MNGYGGELLKLATHYHIPMVVTPPPDHARLCRRVKQSLDVVEECIPPDDRLCHDVADRLLLFRGLVCQVTGLDDRVAVAFAHEMERLAAQLEHQYRCEGQANEMWRVLRVDHRRDRETVPAVLAFPFAVLMEETIHAEKEHLPRIRANIGHCQSLRPELQAILELTEVLPVAVRVLVGNPEDATERAAEWIRWGGTPSHSITG